MCAALCSIQFHYCSRQSLIRPNPITSHPRSCDLPRHTRNLSRVHNHSTIRLSESGGARAMTVINDRFTCVVNVCIVARDQPVTSMPRHDVHYIARPYTRLLDQRPLAAQRRFQGPGFSSKPRMVLVVTVVCVNSGGGISSKG